MEFVIRKATVNDAKEIVEVKTNVWFANYKGLMPECLLNNKINTINDRVVKCALNIKENNNFYVALVDDKIVGVMAYGISKDDKYRNIGEIYFISVLEEFRRKGIGKKLLMCGIEELISMGYNDMILNVLMGNNSIEFCSKFGGEKVESKKEIFGNSLLDEYVMYFKNIKEILL